MRIEALRNKKIIILGFGVEGKSTYEFLNHYFPNQEIAIADQKDGKNYLENSVSQSYKNIWLKEVLFAL